MKSELDTLKIASLTMNKQIEALKMEIDDARIGLGKVRQYLGWQEPKEDELCLEIIKAWKTLDACKEALAEAEEKEKHPQEVIKDYWDNFKEMP